MKSITTTIILILITIILLISIPTFAYDDKILKGSDSGYSEGAESIYPYWGLFGGSACYIAGYDKCYQEEGGYKYDCALAEYLAKQAYSLPESKYCPSLGWYTVNDYKIKYKCVGDKSYNFIGTDKPYCDKNGCTATQSNSLEGEFTVSNNVGHVKGTSVILLCHDYDFDSCDGWWAEAWGFVYYKIVIGTDYVLTCCLDEDCNEGMRCDKSGNFLQWSCVPDPCYNIVCNDRCNGDIKFSDGKCVDGSCQFTQTEAQDYCVENTAFYNGLCVDGELEYTKKLCEDSCIGNVLNKGICIDGKCTTTPYHSQDHCIGDDRFYDGTCQDNKLVYETEQCVFGCNEGLCNPVVQPPEPNIENFIKNLITSIKVMLAELWGLVLEIFRR